MAVQGILNTEAGTMYAYVRNIYYALLIILIYHFYTYMYIHKVYTLIVIV